MIRTLTIAVSCLLLSACASDPYPDWKPLSESQAIEPLGNEPVLPAINTRWRSIATSVQGRPLHAATIGTGRHRVYLVGGIHGDEDEGQHAIDQIMQRFQRDPRVTLRVVRDMNPDGTARASRTNSRGVDLNRNWPASNFQPSRGRGDRPLSEPEAAGVHADLLRFNPNTVVVFHSSTRVNTPFVNYDGPARALADSFARAARPHALNWGVVPSMGYPTPGSLGTFMGIDRDIPILTIEFQLGQSAESVQRSALAGLDAIFAQGRTGARFATGH